MGNLIIKGLKKAVEDLKKMEDGYVALATYNKETKEFFVEGYCVNCFFVTSPDDMVEDLEEFVDFKILNPMEEEELRDWIEFFIDYLGISC